MVAKVDAKNQQLLDTAKSEENRKSDVMNTRNSDAANEKKNDDLTLERLSSILDEFKDDLKNANSGESKDYFLRIPNYSLTNFRSTRFRSSTE